MSEKEDDIAKTNSNNKETIDECNQSQDEDNNCEDNRSCSIATSGPVSAVSVPLIDG